MKWGIHLDGLLECALHANNREAEAALASLIAVQARAEKAEAERDEAIRVLADYHNEHDPPRRGPDFEAGQILRRHGRL